MSSRHKKFRAGDRVLCTDSWDDNSNITGRVGTIVVEEGEHGIGIVGVEFDAEIYGGHSLRDSCKNGYGWYLSDRVLVEYSDPGLDMTPSDFIEILNL